VDRRGALGWGYRLAAFLLLPLLELFTKQEWSGTSNLATGTGIVAAGNHVSYFDPLASAHALWCADRPARFLGKESVFRLPIVGAVVRNAGQIPVLRESADASLALASAIAAARRGECVVLYPEGTLTRDPGLWPMDGKSGAVRIALEADVPLIPFAQWGPQKLLAPYGRRLMLFPRKTMQVKFGTPLDLSDLRGREVSADTLQQATDRLMDAITALLAEVRQETPPDHRYVYDRKGRTQW
jgi:1-acyl-sn-glycerol-3-phosphate acyltransferase